MEPMDAYTKAQPTVLVGVTGCIAAYKSCELVRAFQKRNCRVKVVMTEHATEFVGPTTFRALTREPVAVGLFDEPDAPIHHVSLAKECDVFVIAPCTANVMAKLASGIADDLLTTTALACTAPLVIAPAMNVNMYEDEQTQQNMAVLKAHGVQFVEPDAGYLACGDEGKGRLADIDTIVDAVFVALNARQDLSGLRVLITTGPTCEYIDPVRFISNPSSGKTGFALACAASLRGADVTLVTGPVALEDPSGIDVVHVTSADDMLEACEARFADVDIAICAAAVSDFKAAEPSFHKLKKGDDFSGHYTLELIENPDILATLGAKKRPDQTVIGFAAETDNVVENAKKKRLAKHADMIVANSVSDGKGFGTDDNQTVFVCAEGEEQLPLMTKRELADAILDAALYLRRGNR